MKSTRSPARCSASGKRGREGRRGFTLVEVTMALGIIAFVFVSLFGLCSLGLQSNRDSAEQIQAANLVAGLLDHRRAKPLSDPSSSAPAENIPLPFLGTSADNLSSPLYVDASGQSVAASQAAYRLTYRIVAPASPGGMAKLYLRLTWPATASPDLAATGRFENCALIGTSR